MSPYLFIPAALVLSLVIYGLMRLAAFKRNIVRPPSSAPADPSAPGPLTFTLTSIEGKPVSLAQFQGQVVLLVNVASRCGFTAQYAGLQKLYDTYKDRGLVIIGFPANNFGAQEPGDDSQIRSFCQTRFGVTFPMMAKLSVKGSDIHPLYHFLTTTPGPFAGPIRWNFEKFLIDRSGQITARFGPMTAPGHATVIAAIETTLRLPGSQAVQIVPPSDRR